MTLLDQLAALADDRPAPPPPPGLLWERGRRWQRARRRGTTLLLVTAAALALGLAGLSWERSRPPVAATPYGVAVGLPDRVHDDVSPWLPSGTPGSPLIAVRQADRGGWRGTEQAVVGISATTGEYLFLELPQDAGQGFALSPDGRHVAYWLTGTPSDDPHTAGGQQATVTGLAVLDATTGEVARHDVPTRHGLAPEGLLWADGETLLAGYLHHQGGDPPGGLGEDPEADLAAMTSADEESLIWRLGSDAAPLPMPARPRWSVVGSFTEAAGDLLLIADGRPLLLDLRSGRSSRFGLRSSSGSTGSAGSSAALREDGVYAQVGGPGLVSRSPNKVTTARIGLEGGPRDVQVVPGTGRTYQVLGWRDDETLVVVRGEGGQWPAADSVRMEAVDVRTGESDVLVRYDAQTDLGWTWAGALLDADPVPGREPPRPLDPRVLWGGLLGIAVLTIAALWGWRRRVRP